MTSIGLPYPRRVIAGFIPPSPRELVHGVLTIIRMWLPPPPAEILKEVLPPFPGYIIFHDFIEPFIPIEV